MEMWKTAAAPMEKPVTFPQHSLVWRFTHSSTASAAAAIHPFLSNPKREHKQKKKQERSQRIHRRSRSRFCYGKVLKTATFLSQNSREKTGWEIIRAWPENATTGGYFAFFPPLFPPFFKRWD